MITAPQRLLAYSRYVPQFRLARSAIAAALRGPATAKGQRSIASYDEDALTMAVAAVRRLPTERRAADRLYFATATPPFWDRQNAATVQTASGGRDDALCLDLGGLRGGIGALQLAADTGGVAVLSDLRTGRAGSAEEAEGGDGAAAFLFGQGDGAIAEVMATSAQLIELMDSWRVPGAQFPVTWEERFATSALRPVINEAASRVARAAGLNDLPTLMLVSAPNTKLALGASSGAAAGLAQHKLHRDSIGFCGAADPGLLLAAALDVARAGDTIMVVAAAGGADALLLRVLRDGPGAQPAGGEVELDYMSYLSWRGLVDREPARRPERPDVSAPAMYRNHAWKYALTGTRCTSCGTVYGPPQRVCGSCGSVDEMAPHPFADQPARIASFSTDRVTDSPAPPAMTAVVDIDGGGRFTAEIADAKPEEVAIGTPVEFSFRRTYVVHDTPNYFWKVRPSQGKSQ